MALKFVKAIAKGKEVSIKHMLHRELAGWEDPRPHGTLHASSLLGDVEFCPREWAFLDMGLAKRRKEFLGTAMRITFDHGRDMERRLRNEWLRDYIIGNWECEVCGKLHPTFGKAPKGPCSSCGWNKWGYKETRLESPVSGVSGGIDAFVDVGHPKAMILEIKSMDKDEHKKLAAPLAAHKLRTSLYLRLADETLLKESGRINTQKAKILYVSKSYGFKDDSIHAAGIKDAPFSPFKEFDIERDDSLTDDALNRAKALTLWRNLPKDQPNGLPCGICPNGLGKRAQKCCAVAPCWNGHHPSTITWLEKGKPVHPGKPLIA